MMRQEGFLRVKEAAEMLGVSSNRTLDNLAHYMSKVTIGNSRILWIDMKQEEVTFTYRYNRGKKNPWGEIRSQEARLFTSDSFLALWALFGALGNHDNCPAFQDWLSLQKRVRRNLPTDEDQRNDDWEGEEDEQDAEGDEDVGRRLRKLCGEKTMVVVAKVRRV